MKNNSYLLALDGSIESKAAAELAWNLAKKTGAKVVAQYVVNVRDTWKFLRPKSAGFIGSGPYMEAFERVTSGLRSVGEALMMAYRAQVEEQHIEFETHIDEGDLVAEICKRAKEHDLLIIGHQVSRSAETGQIANYSLCEELADVCPCPMLIVTASCKDWKKIRINFESTKTDLSAIEKLSEFGQKLGLPIELHISQSIPLAKAKALISAFSLCHNFSAWDIYMEGNKKDSSHTDELLVIIPASNGHRSSENDAQLRSYVHELSEPALLLWCRGIPQNVGQ